MTTVVKFTIQTNKILTVMVLVMFVTIALRFPIKINKTEIQTH